MLKTWKQLPTKGALQSKQIQEIRDIFGSEWVGVGLTLKAKYLVTRPKIVISVLIFFGSIPCVF